MKKKMLWCFFANVFCLASYAQKPVAKTEANGLPHLKGSGEQVVANAPADQSIPRFSKSDFLAKANELDDLIGQNKIGDATTKFMETIYLMNSGLAYLETEQENAGTGDKAEMNKVFGVYNEIISLHTDLVKNRKTLYSRLKEFAQTIR